MSRRALLSWSLAAVLLGATVLAASRPGRPSVPADDLCRVLAAAERLGLYVHRDPGSADDPVMRVVVSEMPLTWWRANSLWVDRAEGWSGTAAVYVGLTHLADPEANGEDPGRRLFWRSCLVYGDSVLARRLVAACEDP